jgi:predicted RNase H-like nuclease (RuvC/YqgF family)
MNFEDTVAVAETFLDDLQADVESGGRLIESLDADTRRVDRVVADHLRRAELLGSLARRVSELRECARSQRETLQRLRHQIREIREQSRSIRHAL